MNQMGGNQMGQFDMTNFNLNPNMQQQFDPNAMFYSQQGGYYPGPSGGQ
jgi:hypothetical protein